MTTYNSSRRFKRRIDENGCFTQYCVYFCSICDIECDSTHEFSDHLASPHHAFRWCLEKFEKKRKSLIKERHGICIEVTSEYDVDYRRFKGLMNVKMLPFKPFEMTMEVVNLRPGVGEGGGGGGPKTQKGRYGLGGSGKRGEVILHRVVSLIEGPVLRDSKNSEKILQTPEALAQGNVYRLTARIEGMDVSCYRFPILFVLQMQGANKYFYIIRELVLNVTSGEELGPPPALPEESPYQGLDWGYVSGTHEALCPDGRTIRRLNEYLIPITLLPMFKSKLRVNDVMLPEARESLDDLMELIEDGVNQENYARYFHMLLYHQEFGEQEQIEKFNMTGVTLSLGEGSSLELEVPGLEEKRPSVLKDDLIYLKLRYGDKDEEVFPDQFEGRVTTVKQKTLCFESGNGLSSLVIPGARFDVRFGLNRFPIIVMHRAVDGMVEQDLMDFVFPSEEFAQRRNKKELPKLRFFNKNVEENPEQKQAVINILLGSSMPAPYIVFGPPGTGKTITIVEAILQVLTVCEDSYMLVCTPSNAACDLVTEMLLRYCNPQVIIRLHSRSRDIKSISNAIIKCSNIVNNEIVNPDYEKLRKYRIICCTLISAGKLSMGKLPRDHITHVFIDECGQAVEPEAVSAVAGLLGFRTATIGKSSHNGVAVDDDDDDPENKGCLVLAGDPLQLGPVIASMDIGLGLSLLERLMTRCILYQRQGDSYDPKFITKLVRNFRSHPNILLLPNQLFYENELEAHSQSVLDDPLCSSFPVQFHGVVGGDEKEGSSPSFFNLREVEVVVAYVRCLLSQSFNGATVEQSEIGILTPYTRQVYKLKQALEKKGWNDVEVGSTEVYQGREKRVMIISTVRSAPSAILVDGMYKLGFLSNPKRFNVAITRAQARLIVVGDPYVLSRDQNWMAVIDIAKKNSTYFGAPFIPRDEKFISRLHPLLQGVSSANDS